MNLHAFLFCHVGKEKKSRLNSQVNIMPFSLVVEVQNGPALILKSVSSFIARNSDSLENWERRPLSFNSNEASRIKVSPESSMHL